MMMTVTAARLQEPQKSWIISTSAQDSSATSAESIPVGAGPSEPDADDMREIAVWLRREKTGSEAAVVAQRKMVGAGGDEEAGYVKREQTNQIPNAGLRPLCQPNQKYI
jgi:hypothetical protein